MHACEREILLGVEREREITVKVLQNVKLSYKLTILCQQGKKWNKFALQCNRSQYVLYSVNIYD